LFYLAFARRPDSQPDPQHQLLLHPVGFRELTRVLVRGPQPPSPVAEDAAREVANLTFVQGPEHLMEIGFDGERAGLSADLRPLLPLLLFW
jgi:hypothetical protein